MCVCVWCVSVCMNACLHMYVCIVPFSPFSFASSFFFFSSLALSLSLPPLFLFFSSSSASFSFPSLLLHPFPLLLFLSHFLHSSSFSLSPPFPFILLHFLCLSPFLLFPKHCKFPTLRGLRTGRLGGQGRRRNGTSRRWRNGMTTSRHHDPYPSRGRQNLETLGTQMLPSTCKETPFIEPTRRPSRADDPHATQGVLVCAEPLDVRCRVLRCKHKMHATPLGGTATNPSSLEHDEGSQHLQRHKRRGKRSQAAPPPPRPRTS